MKNKEIQDQLKRFGKNVRQERMAHKLTQEILAEQTQLNVRTIQKIDRTNKYTYHNSKTNPESDWLLLGITDGLTLNG